MTTGMTRWNPSGELLRDRFNRLFEQSFNDFLSPLATVTGEGGVDRPWMPPVDIRETQDELIFVAELPGFTKDEVQITLENDVLTISGERKLEKNVANESWHRMERAYGSFARAFTLPSNVATDKVNATFRDGLLQVMVPKQEQAKPRKISIG
jgi:HSP20 family protein